MDGPFSKWQVIVGGSTVIGAIAAVLALLPHGSGPSPPSSTVSSSGTATAPPRPPASDSGTGATPVGARLPIYYHGPVLISGFPGLDFDINPPHAGPDGVSISYNTFSLKDDMLRPGS